MDRPTRRHTTRGLTEGAIFAAITVVVGAAGVIAPPIAIIFAPLPVAVLVIRWGLRTAVLASVVASVLLLQFFGPLVAFSITAAFAPMGLTLGWGIRRHFSAQWTILAGSLAFLVSTVANLAAAKFVLHLDLIDQLIQAQVKALEMARSFSQRMGAPPQDLEDLRKQIELAPTLIHTLIPLLLALVSPVWAYLVYMVARAVLRRVGYQLPAVAPILTWRVPALAAAVLLWGSGILSMLSLRLPQLHGVALNAIFAGVFIFGFQGVLVGLTWMKGRQVPRFAQIIAVVLLLQVMARSSVPVLALCMIGILDTWFDYRRLGPGAPAPPSDPEREVNEPVPAERLESTVAPERHRTKAVHPR
jgi:uncharacterized protein YybS (DUF2232 family)